MSALTLPTIVMPMRPARIQRETTHARVQLATVATGSRVKVRHKDFVVSLPVPFDWSCNARQPFKFCYSSFMLHVTVGRCQNASNIVAGWCQSLHGFCAFWMCFDIFLRQIFVFHVQSKCGCSFCRKLVGISSSSPCFAPSFMAEMPPFWFGKPVMWNYFCQSHVFGLFLLERALSFLFFYLAAKQRCTANFHCFVLTQILL